MGDEIVNDLRIRVIARQTAWVKLNGNSFETVHGIGLALSTLRRDAPSIGVDNADRFEQPISIIAADGRRFDVELQVMSGDESAVYLQLYAHDRTFNSEPLSWLSGGHAELDFDSPKCNIWDDDQVVVRVTSKLTQEGYRALVLLVRDERDFSLQMTGIDGQVVEFEGASGWFD